MLPPDQVMSVLRSGGFSPLGRVTQRGWIYTVAALDRSGEDGRLIIDARTGQIIRFIPAQAVDERLMAAYGPPGPPPVAYAGYENRRGSLLDLRHAPRPPVSVPKAASRPAPKTANRNAQPAPTTGSQPRQRLQRLLSRRPFRSGPSRSSQRTSLPQPSVLPEHLHRHR
jgi:hypothetical protein